jgi:hypothetical protein
MTYTITGFNLNTRHLSGQGDVRQISIVGDPGATFTLTIYTSDAIALYYNWETGRWETTFKRLLHQKMGSNGYYNAKVRFPLETADTVYNVRLFAEPHFDTKIEIPNVLSPVMHEIKLYQYIDRKITFTSSSDSYTNDYTLPTDVEISGPPSTTTIDGVKIKSIGSGDIRKSISWTHTLNNNRFVLAKQPSIDDIKSTITQTVNGAVASESEDRGLKVVLDSIDGIAVGMKITSVSSGSLSGTPSITAIDRIDSSSTYKQITIDSSQDFADGITLTFVGQGSQNMMNMHGVSFSLNNFNVVLNDVTTTTTSTVDDSTTIPVTSINGIKPKSFAKKVQTSAVSDAIVMISDISDLGIGQVLVSTNSDDTVSGTATIIKLDVDSKKITLNEVVTLTAGTELVFASSFIDSVNICGTSKPYVESISGFNIIANKKVTLDSGETLTFTGSSNSATTTVDVVVSEMGETDTIVDLQLDNILKVS